jgi:hypothetical protein
MVGSKRKVNPYADFSYWRFVHIDITQWSSIPQSSTASSSLTPFFHVIDHKQRVVLQKLLFVQACQRLQQSLSMLHRTRLKQTTTVMMKATNKWWWSSGVRIRFSRHSPDCQWGENFHSPSQKTTGSEYQVFTVYKMSFLLAGIVIACRTSSDLYSILSLH